jgi:hypothetical protein
MSGGRCGGLLVPMVRVSGTNAWMHQGLLRPGISPFRRCTGSLSRTWEPGLVKREKRYDLGHYQGRFCPGLAIRSFMPRTAIHRPRLHKMDVIVAFAPRGRP